MFSSSILSVLFVLFVIPIVDANGNSFENSLLRTMMKEKHANYILEIMTNFSGVIDKIILSTEFTHENLAENLPLGWEACLFNAEYHRRLYCLYENNREEIEKNLDKTHNDTCTYMMNEFPYSEWLGISSFSKRYLSECVEKRLKVFIFGKENGFSIPIDFITNKIHIWVYLENVYRYYSELIKSV